MFHVVHDVGSVIGAIRAEADVLLLFCPRSLETCYASCGLFEVTKRT